MSYQYSSRRFYTPGASKKRKERDSFYSFKPPPQYSHKTTASKLDEPASSNRLLAGYLAYEFLTRGTLLGEKFDPARADASLPLPATTSVATEVKRGMSEADRPAEAKKKEPNSYAEVASILKTDGAHIPGVVNPSQLSRWIQM